LIAEDTTIQLTHIQVVRPVLQLMWNLSVLELKAETTVQQALKSQQFIISDAKLKAEDDEYLSIFRGATGHRNGSALLGAAGDRAGWELF
jgi:hypothetical protein